MESERETSPWSFFWLRKYMRISFSIHRGGPGARALRRIGRESAGPAGAFLHSFRGIAMAVGRIAEAIVKDERAVLPVSAVLDGQ